MSLCISTTSPILEQRPWLVNGQNSCPHFSCTMWQSEIMVLFWERPWVLHPFCNPQCWQLSRCPLRAQPGVHGAICPLPLRPDPTAPPLPFSVLPATRGAQGCTEVCTHCQPHALSIFGHCGASWRPRGTTVSPQSALGVGHIYPEAGASLWMSWFDPCWQLSPTQLLCCSPQGGWGRELGGEKWENRWVEMKTASKEKAKAAQVSKAIEGILSPLPTGTRGLSHLQERRAPLHVMVTWQDECYRSDCAPLPSSPCSI